MAHAVDHGHRALDQVLKDYGERPLDSANEAETRLKVIDRVLREVLGWELTDISVEEHCSEDGSTTFADYIVRVPSTALVVEAKKAGVAFATPARMRSGRLGGALSGGPVGEAIRQARDYCRVKSIPFAVATNGQTWVIFAAVRTDQITFEETEARVFRDLRDIAERFVEFWELLSRQRVIEGNLEAELLGPEEEAPARRLIGHLKDTGFRLGRNAVYEHIEGAIAAAFSDEALLRDVNALDACYVKSSERVKFDSRIQMYLSDSKPQLDHKSIRVMRTRKGQDSFVNKIESVGQQRFVVVLGSVGAGKTTFLQYTRHVSASESIGGRLLWIHADLKEATREDDPRAFLYDALLQYIDEDADFDLGDWDRSIKPAYADLANVLKRGPLHPLSKADPVAFDLEVAKVVNDEREKVTPYVDRILRHALTQRPGFLVVDNVDQITDEEVQQNIFVEANAAARRIGLNVIMAMRDVTYLRHRHSPAFDAFQFDSFYIDAPPVIGVLSRRFSYAKRLLAGTPDEIQSEHGNRIRVPDLGVFFEIVASSLLADETGYMLETLSGGNVRRGLALVRDFLSSGHTSADRALAAYLVEGRYKFPQHEVFKAALLGSRKYFRDEECPLPNLYDAKLGSYSLQLLRLHVTHRFVARAAEPGFEGISTESIVSDLHTLGVPDADARTVLGRLVDDSILRTTDGLPLVDNAMLVPTRLAGYWLKDLASRFMYFEMCLLDAAILDDETWKELLGLTKQIDSSLKVDRMKLRLQRAQAFLTYLLRAEERWLVECKRRGLQNGWDSPFVREHVANALAADMDRASASAARKK